MKYRTLLKRSCFYAQYDLLENEEYYGFGAGASGYVNGKRYTNVNPVNHYIKAVQADKPPILSSTIPTIKEQMEEEMF